MIDIHFIFIIIPLILFWGFYRFIINKKNKSFNKLREGYISLFFIYFLIVVNLTFFKHGYLSLRLNSDGYINLIPFIETIKLFQNNIIGIGNAIYNVLGNILLFIPLGFLIPLIFKKENKLINIALYGFIFSMLIEALQYLTANNITDIDDIIFNTLGAVIGYFIFNLVIKLIYKTKFIKLVDAAQIDYNVSFLFLSFKLLAPGIGVLVTIVFTLVYLSTTSGKLSDKDIAKSVFSYNTNGEYIAVEDFDDYKLFLVDYDGKYINLLITKKVLNNRWIQDSSYQIDLTNKDYGYSITTISKKNYNNLGLVIFGKNFDAETIEIKFNVKEYSKELNQNDYFIVCFPTFETVSPNTDIYNLLEDKESKDLIIKFKEKDGSLCEHIKIN